MFKPIIQWFKSHLRLIKTIFLISVLVIIIRELMTISTLLSADQLAQTFSTIPLWKIGVMFLIGLISILPMIGYDLIFNKLLNQKQKPLYLFETSWMINTINNIAGFGGFVSIGLRSELYGQKKMANKSCKLYLKYFYF